LAPEIGYYLSQAEEKGRFGMDEFFARVSCREGIDLGRSMHHARAVLSVLTEAVSSGEIADVRAQLPEDLKWLLEVGYDEACRV
jgi:uncharacterized protein (DUF2267 family)